MVTVIYGVIGDSGAGEKATPLIPRRYSRNFKFPESPVSDFLYLKRHKLVVKFSFYRYLGLFHQLHSRLLSIIDITAQEI